MKTVVKITIRNINSKDIGYVLREVSEKYNLDIKVDSVEPDKEDEK